MTHAEHPEQPARRPPDSTDKPEGPSSLLAAVYWYLLLLGILWPIGCISRWEATSLALRALPLGAVIGMMLLWCAINRWQMGVGLLLTAGFLLCGKWIGHPVVLGVLSLALLYPIIRRRSEWLPAICRAVPRHAVALLLLVPCSMMSVSAMQYVGIDVWNDVLTGRISHDTCFHAAIASMLGHYNTLSVGLHGLTPLGYHFFSHLLVFGSSQWCGISVLEAYASVPPLVLLPLLPAAMLAAAASLSRIGGPGLSASRAACLSLVFFGFSQGWPLRGLSFQIISESFLCALILFCGFISDLTEPNLRRGSWRWVLWLPILALSKVSVGFLSGCILWLVVLTQRTVRRSYWQHALAASVIAALLFLYAGWWGRVQSIQTAAGSDFPEGYSTYAKWALVTGTIGPFGKYSWPEIASLFDNKILLFAGFFCLMWDWFWVYVILHRSKPAAAPSAPRWFWHATCALFAACVIMVWLAPNLYALVYFLFVPTFMGMLGTLSLLPPDNPAQPLSRSFRSSLGLIGSLALVGAAVSGVSKFASAWVGLQDRSRNRTATSAGFSSYIRLLRDARRDKKAVHFAIHVPPEATSFWGGTKVANRETFKFEEAYRTAFLIPAISEKPSIFGLPYLTDGYFRTIYGLKDHSAAVLTGSLRSHDRAELDAVARGFGLKGILVLPGQNVK
ncbi:MAG: hypothetical protein ABMA01_03450 [Chthoniobacteraceae bacterium]